MAQSGEWKRRGVQGPAASPAAGLWLALERSHMFPSHPSKGLARSPVWTPAAGSPGGGRIVVSDPTDLTLCPLPPPPAPVFETGESSRLEHPRLVRVCP